MYNGKERKEFDVHYRDRLPYFNAALVRLERLLITIKRKIKKESQVVRLTHLEANLKDYEELVRKAERLELKPENAVYTIHDIVRGRVVCNNIEDVYRVQQLLIDELGSPNVFDPEDYIKEPQDSGYRALHLTLRLEVTPDTKPVMYEIPILCELQIRTVLQDAWAELTHYDMYKHGFELPSDLRDRFIDLADHLALAEKTASSIRTRVSVIREVKAGISYNTVNLDGLASIYERAFGKPTSEHVLLSAASASMASGLTELNGLSKAAEDHEFVGSLRHAYREERGDGIDLSSESLFTFIPLVTGADQVKALDEIKKLARSDHAEDEEAWRRDVLSELPATYDEFLKEYPSLDESEVVRLAKALGVYSECFCGQPAMDVNEFIWAVAEQYDVEPKDGDEFDIANDGATTVWADVNHSDMCQYHGYQWDKDD